MKDFFQRFEHYSNVELLKIIKRPEDYQPEAIEAAQQILSIRNISEEDQQEAELYFEDIELNNRLRKEKIEGYNRAIVDFLEPILKPSNKVSPNKWLAIFLVLVAIQYIYMLVKAIIDLVRYIDRGIPIDWLFTINLFGIVYIPFLFILLYKRKRWGWILLLADNVLSGILLLSQAYYIFKLQEYFPEGPGDFIWHLCMRVVFIFFLLRKDVCDFFYIDSEAKVRISMILLGIGILIALFFFGLSYY